MRSFLLVSSLLYVAHAEKRCFDTQGTAIVDASFVPCNSTAAVSACCASNKGQPDICIQGGLCYATQSSYSGYIYGNGCTDSTGSDSSCPYACPMAKTNGWKSYNVLPCTLDRWCCREASDRSNCCNNDTMLLDSDQTSYLGRFIDNVIPGTSTTSTISNNSNSANAVTTSTVTTTITATSSSKPTSTNTTTVVGAAVGAVLGVVCIIALAGLLWMMRKVKTLKKEMQALQSHEPYSNSSSTTPMAQHPYNAPMSEAPTEHAYEADWNNGRYEIDGTGK